MYCVIKPWLLAVLCVMRNITLNIEHASLLQLKPFIYVTYNPVMKTEQIQIRPRQKIAIIWLWLYIIILIKKSFVFTRSWEFSNSPNFLLHLPQLCQRPHTVRRDKLSQCCGTKETLVTMCRCATACAEKDKSIADRQHRFLAKHLATKVQSRHWCGVSVWTQEGRGRVMAGRANWLCVGGYYLRRWTGILTLAVHCCLHTHPAHSINTPIQNRVSCATVTAVAANLPCPVHT